MTDPRLIDADGRAYSLEVVRGGLRTVRELAWLCDGERVTLRDVIGSLQAYEPARSLTSAAIVRYRDGMVSTTTARTELARVLVSEVVLNRGLREAVLSSGMTCRERVLTSSDRVCPWCETDTRRRPVAVPERVAA